MNMTPENKDGLREEGRKPLDQTKEDRLAALRLAATLKIHAKLKQHGGLNLPLGGGLDDGRQEK